MALIPKSQYKGTVSGRRAATPAERNIYGKTIYPAGSHAGQTVHHVEIRDDKFTPIWMTNASGNITIVIQYEVWNNYKKQWEPRIIDGKHIDRQIKFYNMQAVIAYVLKNMQNKPNTKPSKRMISKDGKVHEYFISTPKPSMVWNKTAKQWVQGSKEFSNNPNWNIKPMFFSQWVTVGNQWITRTTYEQVDDIEFNDNDYHNPKPSPWSHHGVITPKDKTRPRTVRTYLGADKEDTTLQRNQAYWRQKRAIQREYDDYTRASLNMSPQEYRQYKHDIEHMNNDEWHQKYGVNHSYYND